MFFNHLYAIIWKEFPCRLFVSLNTFSNVLLFPLGVFLIEVFLKSISGIFVKLNYNVIYMKKIVLGEGLKNIDRQSL